MRVVAANYYFYLVRGARGKVSATFSTLTGSTEEHQEQQEYQGGPHLGRKDVWTSPRRSGAQLLAGRGGFCFGR